MTEEQREKALSLLGEVFFAEMQLEEAEGVWLPREARKSDRLAVAAAREAHARAVARAEAWRRAATPPIPNPWLTQADIEFAVYGPDIKVA